MAKVIGKLRATVVLEWSVEDLENYNAKNLKEAANLTKKQFEDGDFGLDDLTSWSDLVSLKIEVVDG